MPYVTPESRTLVDGHLRPLADTLAQHAVPGLLAYCVYVLVSAYVGRNVKFSRAAEAFGVLQTVGLEFYRRVVGPYEGEKRAVNGDVG